VKKKDLENASIRPLTRSAQKALEWLRVLLTYAESRIAHATGPSVSEILARCEKTGCSLHELARYETERSAPPALVLFGGDRQLAERLAHSLALAVTFGETKAPNVVWEVQAGAHESWALRYNSSKRRISAGALEAFLKTGVAAGDMVTICRTVQGSSPSNWRFIWVPLPIELDAHWATPEGIGILVAQHASVIVSEDIAQGLAADLRALGQRRWEVRRQDLQDSDLLARLEAEVSTLLQTTPSEQAVRVEAAWRWLRDRCRDSIEEQRKEVQKTLELQAGRLKRVDQLLAQYHQSWTRGFHNEVEAHLRLQLKTPAMGKLVEGKKAKLTIKAFLQAMALAGLRSRLEEFVVEHLAEFVSGLSALAAKLDLPKLSLAQDHTSWSADNLAARLEAVLTEKRAFSVKKGRSRGASSGRSSGAQEERKRRIDEASAWVSTAIEASWSEWCADFFDGMKKRTEQALEASIVASGQLTVAQLQEKIAGMDSITAALYGEEKSAAVRTNAFVQRLLRDFTHQKWLHPAHT
jgi:hypothetical protein